MNQGQAVDRLESMTTFVRIVDAGSLSAAGRLLRLSLPAVSRQLAALETRLGVELIRRTTRRIALTETGTIYYQTCRRILAEIDEADEAASGLHGEPRGTLVVDGPGTFGHLYLAPLIPRFLARHPQLQLNLRLNDRLVDLIEERTDLLVRVGRVPDSTTLIARRLAQHPRVVCASPGYLARTKRPTRPEELAQHECILLSLLSAPDRWELRATGESITVHVRGRVLINDGAAMRRTALADGGVIFAPSWLVADDVRRGSLEVLLPGWIGPIVPVHALYARHRSASAKVRVLVSELVRDWSRRTDWFV
jgi:DNA-binding transcriptional LysR family regulator